MSKRALKSAINRAAPVAALIFLRKINEYRVGIRNNRIAIFQHRHLPEAVERKERGRPVFAAAQIDLRELGLDADKRQEQADAVRMTG